MSAYLFITVYKYLKSRELIKGIEILIISFCLGYMQIARLFFKDVSSVKNLVDRLPENG